MHGFFDSLLGSCDRFVIFAAMLRLDGNVNQFIVLAEQLAIGIRTLWLMRHDGNHSCKLFDADLPDVQISHE